MARLILFPSESAQITLESPLTAGEIVQAINSGDWQPPPQVANLVAGKRFQAVHMGRNTVLAFLPPELQSTSGEAPSPPHLSPRQTAILQCLAEGLTVQQIGLRLGLSRRTVFLHLAAIRRNMHATTTQEALLRAAALGLCRPGPHRQENVPD
jgi:DNA-binding NarL/FixJ family response regulator